MNKTCESDRRVYTNAVIDMKKNLYSSMRELLVAVVFHLEQFDKLDETIAYFLGPEPSDKKLRDPNMPKKPLSAYFLFCKQERAKPDFKCVDVIEASKVLGKKWQNMSLKRRSPFQEQHCALKEDYEIAMEKYRNKISS